MPSHIETLLRPGERILYQARLSKFLLIFYGLLGILSLAGVAFFGLMAINYAGKFNWKSFDVVSRDDCLMALISGLCILPVLYFCAKYLYAYFKTEIVVTDQRVMGRVRRFLVPFTPQPIDLPLSEIESLYFFIAIDWYYGDQDSTRVILDVISNLIVAVADFGTVIVVSKAGRKVKLHAVTAPRELERQISEAANRLRFSELQSR